jgi:hypothetical protein
MTDLKGSASRDALACAAWWREEFPEHPNVWAIYEDFKVFLRLVWAHLGLPEPTQVQLDIADYLQYGPRRKIIEAFRGVGKSYITSAFVCWLLLRNPDLAIMVVSASKQRADDFSTFTKRLIREMPILQHLQAGKGQRDSNVSFDVGPAKAKHSPSVKSTGITGQLSGSRAHLIVADDVEVPSNSETQTQRDKLSELVKEFDAVLIPGGHTDYLGTPQTEQSLYNALRERGYEARVWPSEVPAPEPGKEDKSYLARMRGVLAPFILKLIDKGLGFGRSTDPKRFTEVDLAERKLSYGASGYALQFLLDTSLSDANRYPLRLKDLIVMPLDALKGPASVAWGPKPSQMLHDVHTPGLDGDAFYSPAFVDTRYEPYTGSVMFVDPSGRGSDETSWAVVKHLNGMLFNTVSRGMQGGYEDHVLKAIAADAKTQGVNLIRVESNFGQGMFAKLLQPHLAAIGHKCVVEEFRSTGQKELRIIQVMEPLLNQHRLVVNLEVVEEDNRSVADYPADKQRDYRLFYQLTRITKLKGALGHDDRLDALAGACAYWADVMAQDAKAVSDKQRDKAMEKAMREHLANQLVAFDGPGRKTRKQHGGNFVLSPKKTRRGAYEI